MLAIPVALWAFVMQAREDDTPRKSFQARVIRGVLTVLVLGLVVAAAISFKHHLGDVLHLNSNAVKGGAKGLTHGRQSVPPKYEPQFEWIVLWVAVAAAAVGVAVAAVLYAARMRKRARAVPTSASRLSARTSLRRSATRSTTSRPSPTRGAR